MIVRAALQCVAGGDWETTSLQAVRLRAGVSNGSLFHHFRTRHELTSAVVAAALEEHQQVLLAELAADAEEGVASVVRRHLRWMSDNPAVAQLLLATPPEVLRQSVSTPVLDANRRFFQTIAGWLREHGWREQPPLPVVLALWIGPAQEFSRQQLATRDTASLVAAADDLARGAWAALGPLLNGEPTARGAARR